MSTWRNCEDCCKAKRPWPYKLLERIAKENNFICGSQYRELNSTVNLSRLCDKCIIITPCSLCNTIILKSDLECDKELDDEDNPIRLEISNWNEEPICTICKEVQCYRCGEEGYEVTWYGWVICEECSMTTCNTCGGECDKPCSNCKNPCDNCMCS